MCGTYFIGLYRVLSIFLCILHVIVKEIYRSTRSNPYIDISIVIPVLGVSNSITPERDPVRIKFSPPKNPVSDYTKGVRTKPVELNHTSLMVGNKFEIHPLAIKAPHHIPIHGGLSALCRLLSFIFIS